MIYGLISLIILVVTFIIALKSNADIKRKIIATFIFSICVLVIMLICFGLSFSIKDTFKLDNLFSDNEYITSYETENNKMIVVYAHERDDNDIYYHIKVYNKFLFLYFKDENYYRVKKVSSKDNEYFELTFLEIEKSQYCFVDFNYSNIESLKINGKIIEKDGEYTMFILYDLNKESKIEVNGVEIEFYLYSIS